MAERPSAALRLLATTLLIANAALAVYIAFTPSPEGGTARRIQALQINADRIRIVDAATRGPQGSNTAEKPNRSAASACLEWSPIDAAGVAKAQAALGRMGLAERSMRRSLGEAGGVGRYALYIRDPDQKVVERVAEIKSDFAGSAIKAVSCP